MGSPPSLSCQMIFNPRGRDPSLSSVVQGPWAVLCGLQPGRMKRCVDAGHFVRAGLWGEAGSRGECVCLPHSHFVSLPPRRRRTYSSKDSWLTHRNRKKIRNKQMQSEFLAACSWSPSLFSAGAPATGLHWAASWQLGRSWELLGGVGLTLNPGSPARWLMGWSW